LPKSNVRKKVRLHAGGWIAGDRMPCDIVFGGSGLRDLGDRSHILRAQRSRAALGAFGYVQAAGACLINKADINPEIASDIRKFMQKKKIADLGDIEYSDDFPRAIAMGRTLIEENETRWRPVFERIWKPSRRKYDSWFYINGRRLGRED